MFRISAMYPSSPDARFDLDYYRATHIPLVLSLMGEHGLQRIEVDRGLEGPGGAPVYSIVGHMYVESLEGFQAGMAEHGKAIMGDVKNFTDARPEVQMSEILG